MSARPLAKWKEGGGDRSVFGAALTDTVLALPLRSGGTGWAQAGQGK